MSGLIVGLAFFLASFVHTITGFGSALVGMPVLVLGIGLSLSVPLMALLSQIVNVIVLIRNWRGIQWIRALVLIVPSIFGVPLGLLILKKGNEDILNIILGCILVFHSIFLLFFEDKMFHFGSYKRVDYLLGIFAGFIAGILGGAYNANGPPVIIYTSLFEKEKMSFRSILQIFFVINGFIIICAHYLSGLITSEVWKLSLYGIPGLVLGSVVGIWLDKYITPRLFRNLVIIGILSLGLVLISQAIL